MYAIGAWAKIPRAVATRAASLLRQGMRRSFPAPGGEANRAARSSGRSKGASLRGIAADWNSRGTERGGGAAWRLESVARIVKQHW